MQLTQLQQRHTSHTSNTTLQNLLNSADEKKWNVNIISNVERQPVTITPKDVIVTGMVGLFVTYNVTKFLYNTFMKPKHRLEYKSSVKLIEDVPMKMAEKVY